MKEEGVLYRMWIEDGKTNKCILVPKVLHDSMLILAHNYSGHNGGRRTYNCLKKQYYWPGIRKQVFKHCKNCRKCILQNQGQAEHGFSHFNTPDLPMQFICMDLVGPIQPASSRGNRYMLIVIDMLTGFTIAVPIPDKSANTVCGAYCDHVFCVFGGSSRILTDNGSEFKNKEMKEICDTLGIKQIFSPVYTPQSNGRLEGWHRFFKACIAKHVRGHEVEWDELVPLVISAYNFFPCQSSKESPFLLMFGQDPITPVAQLLEPKLRYYGEKGNFLQMDSLRRLYAVVTENLKKARTNGNEQQNKTLGVKINDLVLVKDPDSAVFEPRFQPNFRVTAIYGNNRIEVQDEKGNKLVRRSAHIKKIDPAEKVIQQLPPREVLENYGRSVKLLISAKDIPDVGFPQEKLEEEVCEVTESPELTECSECSINSCECPQRHDKHVKSGEGYEHSIPSKEHEVNPLDARRTTPAGQMSVPNIRSTREKWTKNRET